MIAAETRPVTRARGWSYFLDDVPYSGADSAPHSHTLIGETNSLGDNIWDPEADAIASHIAYLGRMTTEGVVPAEISAKARTVWELARKAVPGLSVPLAVAHEGGPIHYTWDNGRHVIALECLSGDQPCEWYVSDRATRFSDGGEFDLASALPDEVIAMCREYLRHPSPRPNDAG